MRSLSSTSSRFLVALTLCLAPSQARPAELETGLLAGLGDTRYHLLTSQILQRDFHVFVRLPERYREQPDRGFPTVYLLDGGITFPLLAGYYRYLSLAEEVPDAILVGVDRAVVGQHREAVGAPNRDPRGPQSLLGCARSIQARHALDLR